jgi:hypothetical protein
MEKDHKPIFDMTQEELDNHLRPTAEEAVAKRFRLGLPVSYRDDRCPTAAHFIHEYEDGRKFLVLLNESTMKYTTIRQLA